MNRTMPDQVEYTRGIAPVSANSAQTGAWVDVHGSYFVQYILTLGDVGNGTIDFKLRQAKTSGGANAKDIPGAAIVRITAHATNNDNTQYSITVRTSRLDTDNGFSFIAPVVTPAQTSLISAQGVLYRINFVPKTDNGLTQDVRIR